MKNEGLVETEKGIIIIDTKFTLIHWHVINLILFYLEIIVILVLMNKVYAFSNLGCMDGGSLLYHWIKDLFLSLPLTSN